MTVTTRGLHAKKEGVLFGLLEFIWMAVLFLGIAVGSVFPVRCAWCHQLFPWSFRTKFPEGPVCPECLEAFLCGA